jgi:hypothetical protein
LWEIANKDGDIKAHSNTSPTVSPVQLCLLPGVVREYSLHTIRWHRSRAPPTGPP